MNIEQYLDEMRIIQDNFLEFIENDGNVEENFQNLYLILEDKNMHDNKNDLKLFLHHVANVCAKHHHNQNFFGKIERIIQIFKDDFKKFYTNSEIFNIFKRNKRILLFLIEEKIIIFDKYVTNSIIQEKYVKKKYPQYFAPEIKTFIEQKWFPKYDPDRYFNKNQWIEEIKKELPDNFYELRKIGENESYISKLIREDNVEEFIAYVNQSNKSIHSQIKLSIYETNSFLIKEQNQFYSDISLIKYASFFGSIQIIKYLVMQGEEITPSLWLYAIHSQNAELIHYLEDCHIEPTVSVYEKCQIIDKIIIFKCFIESIKCNHNALADYILNNYLENDDKIQNVTFNQSIKYYNFKFMQNNDVNESSFCKFCIYDYYFFVDDLLTNKNVDINKTLIKFKIFNEIQNHIFLENFI